MHNMLTSIGGQFGKPFLIGMLLPALIFFALLDLSLDLGAGFVLFTTDTLSSLDALLLVVGITVLALVLYLFNIPIYRLLEGYTWERTRLGQRRVASHKRTFRALQLRRSALFRFVERRSDPQFSTANDIREEVVALAEVYPFEEKHILPTRLGNAMRRCELYALEQYGMDTIILWPRLIDVISDGYAQLIQDARTHLDFTVNTVFLLLVLAAVQPMLVLFLVVYSPTVAVAAMLAAGAAAGVLYMSAVSNAQGWGELIKATTDLYRWQLLERLGVKQQPTTLDEERQLWLNITRQLEYGDRPTSDGVHVPRFEYSAPETQYPSIKADGEVTIFRTFQRVDAVTLLVATRLSNAGTGPVRSILVEDRLPDGYLLSAVPEPGGGCPLRVSGSGPYHFNLTGIRLRPGESLEYEYRMIRDVNHRE